MIYLRLFILTLCALFIFGCGKVGPLSLSEDTIDKSVITYPCNEDCQKKFEEEKKRQKSVIIQTD